jgi:hypothetical protein
MIRGDEVVGENDEGMRRGSYGEDVGRMING